ncbi:MAG: acpH [Bacteroidetes bacterium]|jgi:acyl carrier protein phosphodiesterase|nr:acpH [Bacteroidota bacterium]
MNFLSHLFLSGNSEGLIIGNFIADSVKGSDYKNYPEEIQKGILLHRQIDTFTDKHPIVEESKIRLREKYHKYSSVIIDVYYDHFLASNWDQFSSVALNDYTKEIYSIIQNNQHFLPDKARQFMHYMIQYNILEAYSRLEGIQRVLEGMAGRAKFESNMEHSIHDLREHYSLFENEFKKYFPELQQFVNEQIGT